MKDNERDAAGAGGEAGRPVAAEVESTPPTPDAAQLPGFKVVDEAPSRGGMKLVWTALVVILAIGVGYYFGVFR